MKEWELHINRDPGYQLYEWIHKGELELSLSLIKCGEKPPYFEILRNIDRPEHAFSMLSDWQIEYALKDIEEHGYYGDIFWMGHSPQELEEFFRESRLPLPEEYKTAWDHIQNIE